VNVENGKSLPPGWIRTTIGEISEVNKRNPALRAYPDEMLVTFVPMAAVDANIGVIASPQIRPLGEVRKGFTPFSNGDVIIAKITPSMENGKAAIAKDLHNGIGFGSTEFHVMNPKNIVLPSYLFYFIRQESFRWDAKANFAGTAGQLRVPSSFVENYPIPLPPLPEQERIVARIESLFTQLDAGVAALKRAQAALKRYKASVLKAACEGRLVAQEAGDESAEVMLRRMLAERGEKFVLPNGELAKLPRGWMWVTLEQLSNNIVDCLHSTPKFVSEGKYCIDTTCIEPGCILFDKARVVSAETYKDRIRRLKPEVGDILFSREGTIGTTVVVPGGVELCLGQRMMMFRPSNMIISNYFMWAMLSNTFERQWKPKIIGTTSPHINIGDIRHMALPLPPYREQFRIVAEVERRLSVVQELEQTIEANLKRAGRLRQAVLKMAFEGRLVS
jgi:type I restriction enzyme S subunit